MEDAGASPNASAKEAVDYAVWPPSQQMRDRLVERIATNLTAMSFFDEKTERIDDKAAAASAARIESTAYAAAETAGSGALKEYANKAAELVLAELQQKSVAAAPPAKAPTNVFDVSGGKREKVDTKAAAEELLKPILTAEHSYTKVVLSNKSFNQEGAQVVAAALAASKAQLTEADLSDIIAGQEEKEALRVLEIITGALIGSKLQSLNLSDNALGEKGVRAAKAIFENQSSLQHLYFCNNGISPEAAAAIHELLAAPKELRTLHFYNNMSGDDGAKILAKVVTAAPVLEDFRFSSTRVGSEGGAALASALLSGSSLQRLDLKDNGFGPEGGMALAKALTAHPKLREAILSDLSLEDEGSVAVAKALASRCPDLEVLDLSGNDITPKAATAVAEAIRGKQKLRKLNLADNDLRDRGAAVIAKVLEIGHESLEELDLTCNSLGHMGAVAAAKAVVSKPAFKLLSLNDNHISEKGLEELQDLFQDRKEALGSLEDNDEEGEEEDEEDEEEEEGEEEEGPEAGELAEKLGGLKV
ncbi:Ran GTPase-activating protein [Klebsormidium nitens]|uniref:Ran GTPase-activating protein n=1 Tax=Klebsormidium nitens TaxID=105231 RepID=A0A1Y1IRF6_KLENI|nr:Ran GTPase-activating protein [Klebsormidium nitens]|eukprot:GAQ91326.1 Ran GTPase-activating protein [Klebsormidium nitens]